MNKPRPVQHLVILVALTPFLVAFSAAIVVAGLQLDVPRQLVPGEGLAFLGLAASCAMGLVAWFGLRRIDAQRRFRTLGSVATGLAIFLGAPAWALGVLPTLNGLQLSAPAQTPMSVAKGQPLPKGGLYPFVVLAPLPLDRELPAGRYFLTESIGVPADLPLVLTVTHAKGLLGARVVLAVGAHKPAP